MIFDRNKFYLHQNKAEAHLKSCKFLEYARHDIHSRLELIDHNYNIIKKLDIRSDENNINLTQSSCDLIISCLGLHFINSVELFLSKILQSLSSNGVFIANFIGGSSLKSLRQKLIGAEELARRPHSSHISPFIMFEHVAPLFQKCGFADIIVDYEKIKLEYKSSLALMKDLNKYGQSNCLLSNSNYGISKAMHRFLAKEDQVFQDEVTLISVIAGRSKGSIRTMI